MLKMKLKFQIRKQSKRNINFRMPWTKEQKAEYHRQWRINNKEKIAESNRQYYQENKEKKAEYNKQYIHTPQGRKVSRISDWKYAGLVDSDNDNYESIYDYYVNTQKCENCDVELTEGQKKKSTTRCLDHSHTTGLFRNILCHACNNRRREDNF